MIPEPQFIELDVVESTMIEATNRLARGEAAPWTTIIAHHQIAGRGRHDRRWETKPGDALLATVIAPVEIPFDRIGLLALGTGVAIVTALEQSGVGAMLKWPNDVYVDGRKLAGVLIQTRMEMPVTALIGIGLNLRTVPPGLENHAACLAEFVPDIPEPRQLAGVIVRRLQGVIGKLQLADYLDIITQWTARALWLDQDVVVEEAEPIIGRFVGVDDRGRMRLATPAGMRLIAEGDVRRGPRALD